MAFTLKVDTSVWDRIRKNLVVGDNLQVSTGFFEDSVYGEENNNAQVAQIARDNEEGTVKNPTRPFMRVGFGGKVAKQLPELFKANMKRIAEGKSTFTQEYTKLGSILTTEMKQSIIEWSTPPNSPRTIADKGFNDPLIKTGTMLESVESKVEVKP